MVKASQNEVRSQLRRLDPRFQAALVYGKDEGLVRERVAILAGQILEDPEDAFALARPDTGEVSADPAQLADELMALSLTGGRRLVRLDHAGDGVAKAAALALEVSAGENFLLISAGDLGPASRLRKLFEASDNAIALPCYADEGVALERIIVEGLAEHGLTAEPAALAYLASALQGNRMIARMELEKLALYVGDQEERNIDLTTAEALVGDASELRLGRIAEAVTGGQPAALDHLMDRAVASGESPISILRALAIRFQRLDFVSAEAAASGGGGAALDAAIGKLRPPVFFKEKDSFRLHASRWEHKRLQQALEMITEAEVACKSADTPGMVLASRLCLRLAVGAARQSRAS